MNVELFMQYLKADFFTGVPDSLLSPLCDYLIDHFGTDPKHHIIAANEGNAVAIAAGRYMATKKIPVVYMQNSGEGNAVNPIASLCNKEVYGIPMIFVIGWRGEPGVKDEPQHAFQGRITTKLLEVLDVQYCIIDNNSDHSVIENAMTKCNACTSNGKQFAFVIKKGALTYEGKKNYKNKYQIVREEAIRRIVSFSKNELIVATTGKIGRELFEIREQNGETHECDFLTVGSMGHCSSIALGLAASGRKSRVWILDGDGAVIMHMGSMAVIGSHPELKIVHVVINNEAHESVGGLPTAAKNISIVEIAKACGYPYAVSADNMDKLKKVLCNISKVEGLSLVEIKCSIGSRPDLGRPTIAASDNLKNFMDYCNE